MPIRKTEFKKGKIYHIYNQGEKEKDIFLNENDKERFFQSIFLSNNSNSYRGISELEKNRESISIEDAKKVLKKRNIKINPLVKIYSVCLMPNHFHFIVRENEKNGISFFMQKLCNSYGKYFSKKYNQGGNVFGGRFKTAQISGDNQLKYLFAYINTVNPAQLAEPYLKIKGVENFALIWDRAENYKWSSYPVLMGLMDSLIIDKGFFLKTFGNSKAYSNFAKEILLGKRNDIWVILKNIAID